ncbi:MAG: hypothetical protein HQ507_03790 [Candidatus Marinimicrobia bacterium]|nr:hypothetical protein [Candidatus Neomarinimicrobiota bacterium]
MNKSAFNFVVRKSSAIGLNLLLFILISACVPEVQQSLLLNDNEMGSSRGYFKSEIDPLTISAVDRGMSRQDIQSEIGVPKHSYIIENGSIEYVVDVHPVIIKMKKITTSTTSTVSGATTTSTGSEYVPVYGPYYLIYYQDLLWVWGRDQELKKNENPALQQIIPTVMKGYVSEQLKIRQKMLMMQRLLYGIPSGLFLLVAIYAVTSS